ncbi:MAG: oligosaccharide flippase family protein [Bacteroidaceae bacterium]|nr:oligosaccharide flippase family protein [Bacteroidaceae bacterium]
MYLRRYKQVIENFFSLSVLNAVNIVLQLVTLPYILSVVGKGNYGIYSYVFMVVQYIILFSTYGFNFSATKKISLLRDDSAAVTRIYNAVIGCKMLIAIVLVVAVVLCSGWVFEEEIGFVMFLLGTGMIVGDILNPVWLFQGMEKMKYMTLVNSSSKIIFTVLVFFVVRSVDDFYLLILLNSCGYLLAGILSVFLAYKQFNVRLGMPRFDDMIAQFKDGGAMFGSTFGMNLYRNAHVLILKHFASNEAVGLFSAAEKVIHGFQSVIQPAAQALFPHMSFKFKDKSTKERLSLMKKVMLPLVGLSLVAALFVYIFAPWISDILCGKDFRECVPLIRIMSLVIIFGEVNCIAGIVGLVNMDRQNYFFRSVLVTGVCSCLITLALVHNCGAYSGAISLTASEALLMCMCLYGLFYKSKVK